MPGAALAEGAADVGDERAGVATEHAVRYVVDLVAGGDQVQVGLVVPLERRAITVEGVAVHFDDHPLTELDRKAHAVLGDKVVGASSIEGTVRECDLLIVATAWPEYKAIDPAWCKRNGQRLTILDLWRTLPAGKFGPVADVLYLGSGR